MNFFGFEKELQASNEEERSDAWGKAEIARMGIILPVFEAYILIANLNPHLTQREPALLRYCELIAYAYMSSQALESRYSGNRPPLGRINLSELQALIDEIEMPSETDSTFQFDGRFRISKPLFPVSGPPSWKRKRNE